MLLHAAKNLCLIMSILMRRLFPAVNEIPKYLNESHQTILSGPSCMFLILTIDLPIRKQQDFKQLNVRMYLNVFCILVGQRK
jgi:hypothetical protein